MRIIQFQVEEGRIFILMEDGRLFLRREGDWEMLPLPEHPMGMPKNPLGPPPEDKLR